MIARLALPLVLAASPASADERRVMVTGFDAVRVDGPFDVRVTTGTAANAVVAGDRRAIEAVEVRVEDRTLIVSANAGAWGGWPGEEAALPVIAVQTPRLQRVAMNGSGRIEVGAMRGLQVEVALSGSGTIRVGEVEADDLRVELVGTGPVTLAGSALRARFSSIGAASIEAEALAVRDLTITSESLGDARLSASETADVTALGLGSISVSGDATCRVRGPGPVRCGRGGED